MKLSKKSKKLVSDRKRELGTLKKVADKIGKLEAIAAAKLNSATEHYNKMSKAFNTAELRYFEARTTHNKDLARQLMSEGVSILEATSFVGSLDAPKPPTTPKEE